MYDFEECGAADVAEMASRVREACGGLIGRSVSAETSVREVMYQGRLIRVETTYAITVDGDSVVGPVFVDNAGRVSYHQIPEQEFESAIDLVQRVIDLSGFTTPPS